MAEKSDAGTYRAIQNSKSWSVGNDYSILYEEALDETEARLLASAYNRGASTYLEACELQPELKRYWDELNSLQD